MAATRPISCAFQLAQYSSHLWLFIETGPVWKLPTSAHHQVIPEWRSLSSRAQPSFRQKNCSAPLCPSLNTHFPHPTVARSILHKATLEIRPLPTVSFSSPMLLLKAVPSPPAPRSCQKSPCISASVSKTNSPKRALLIHSIS